MRVFTERGLTCWIPFRTGKSDLLEKYKALFGWDWLLKESYGIYFFRGISWDDSRSGTQYQTWDRQGAEEELAQLRFCEPELLEELTDPPRYSDAEPKPDGIWEFLSDAPPCVANALIQGRWGGMESDIMLYLGMSSPEKAGKVRELLFGGRKFRQDGCYHCFGCRRKSGDCSGKYGIKSTFGYGVDLSMTKWRMQNRKGSKYEIRVRPSHSRSYYMVTVTSENLSSQTSFGKAVISQIQRQGGKMVLITSQDELHQRRFRSLVQRIQDKAQKGALQADYEPLRFVKSVMLVTTDRNMRNAFIMVCRQYGISLNESTSFAFFEDEDDYDIIATDDEKAVSGVKDKSRILWYGCNHKAEHYLPTLSSENVIKGLSTVTSRENAELREKIAANKGRGSFQRNGLICDFLTRRYLIGKNRIYLMPNQELALYDAMANDLNLHSMPERMREYLSDAGVADLFE